MQTKLFHFSASNTKTLWVVWGQSFFLRIAVVANKTKCVFHNYYSYILQLQESTHLDWMCHRQQWIQLLTECAIIILLLQNHRVVEHYSHQPLAAQGVSLTGLWESIWRHWQVNFLERLQFHDVSQKICLPTAITTGNLIYYTKNVQSKFQGSLLTRLANLDQLHEHCRHLEVFQLLSPVKGRLEEVIMKKKLNGCYNLILPGRWVIILLLVKLLCHSWKQKQSRNQALHLLSVS